MWIVLYEKKNFFFLGCCLDNICNASVKFIDLIRISRNNRFTVWNIIKVGLFPDIKSNFVVIDHRNLYFAHQVVESDVNISKYLEFLQHNETRAKNIINESKEVIINIDESKNSCVCSIFFINIIIIIILCVLNSCIYYQKSRLALLQWFYSLSRRTDSIT